ncbi:gibberellin 2-beta-dioxygenase 3 [Camellia sinensis]|uniref:gibberellin 2-beta-dioxygenase 3 n=1 Tax=Camellia sinensis TaxID=4442 RepID=UPI001036EDFC|nr:gibberellin 2-beta-dioxygenase 3 [Camellia sinensis]
MASSTHHLPNPYGTTAAPPPTPSTQPNPLPSSAPSADVLSRLLHRLPPTLSLPTRLSPPPTTITTTTSPPLISLSPQNPTLLTDLLSASCQFGFFHLTNHSISPQLARSAESDSLSLFTLSNDQKQIHFPKNWPLGFDCDDNEDDDGTSSDSFCFDSACSPESTELSLSSLREFTREMEKVGLEVVEALSCAVGFENPVREDPTRVCSLMWISEGSPGNTTVRFYPYVVGLEYQIRCRKYSLLADSGWVSDSPRVDSILVTLGDIAQVWSNGKMKKVRGRPVPSFEDGSNNNNAHCISMSLLVTLPLESMVSPLLPKLTVYNGEEDNQLNKEDDDDNGDTSADTREDGAFKFNSFSFEDYAWRIYHERLLLKDPLARYRI